MMELGSRYDTEGDILMSEPSIDNIEFDFKSDLIDLGTMSLRALRGTDSAALRAALDRVVQQSGQSTKPMEACSSGHQDLQIHNISI